MNFKLIGGGMWCDHRPAQGCTEADANGHPCIKGGDHDSHNNGHGTAWRYFDVEEVDEAIQNLHAALANADGERRDIIADLLDSALDRRLELTE